MKQVIPFSKEIAFKTNIASITSISLEHEEKVKEGEIAGDFIVFGDYKIHNDTTEKELFKYRLPFTALIPENIEPSSIRIDVQDFTYDQINDDVLRVDIDFYLEGDEIIKEENEDDEEERNKFDEAIDKLEENQKIETLDEEPQSIDIGNEPEFLKVDDDIDREIAELLNLTKKDNEEAEEKIIEVKDNTDCTNNEETRGNEMINEMVVEGQKEENTKIEEIDKKVEMEKTTEVVEEKKEDNKEEKVTQKTEEYVTYHVHIVKAEETLESILKLYGTSIDDIKDYNDLSNIEIGQKIIIPEYVDE